MRCSARTARANRPSRKSLPACTAPIAARSGALAVAVHIDDPASARAAGIAMVFQELSLAPDLDVVDNMFLGRERSCEVPALFDRGGEEEACRAMLDQLGLRARSALPVRRLGMAQRQMLEIGKALSQEPKVLILDEPTASLTRREIEQLFALDQAAARRGHRDSLRHASFARGAGNRRPRQHHARRQDRRQSRGHRAKRPKRN